MASVDKAVIVLKAGAERGVDVPYRSRRGEEGEVKKRTALGGLISNSPLCHLHRRQLEFLWRGFRGCAMSICMMAKAALSTLRHPRVAETLSRRLFTETAPHLLVGQWS